MLHRLLYIFVFSSGFLSLLAERFWSSFWPAVSVIFAITALALLGLPSAFGLAGHIIFLFLSVVAIAASLRFGAKFHFPRGEDVARRIEKESHLKHRPLATLRDKPVEQLSTDALLLWQKHVVKSRAAWKKARSFWPAPDTARQDPYALRYAAFLILIVGIAVAQHEAPRRLTDALTPDIKISAFHSGKIEGWITPPDYTSAAPQLLTAAGGSVTVPEGSILKLRLSGFRLPPSLSYNGEKYKFKKPAAGSHTLEIPLTASSRADLRQFILPVTGWDITVTPDRAPEISITSAEEGTRATTKITYAANDDYALKSITGEISSPETGETYFFDLGVASAGRDSAVHTEDLSWHRLAGSKVLLTLTAEDGHGQSVRSAPKEFYLPERKFTNPTAEQLALERKRLILFNNSGNPITQRLTFEALGDIANHPQYYKGDPRVFLGLAMAVKRIAFDGDDESIRSVELLLWNLALRIEDGGLSLAARDLSDALQNLSQALNDKKTGQEELQRLTEEVQKKMRAYVQALAQEMAQRMEQGKPNQMMSPELAEKFMKHIDMNEMIQQMRALSQGDSREQMQRMAEMLKNGVNNLDLNKLDQMNKAQQQAMESLEDMQTLIREQQKLLDETNKMLPDEESNAQEGQQKVLREKLGDIMRRLGEVTPEVPENFGKADQSMKESGRSLAKDLPKDSAPHQKTALDELQKGMDQTIEKMAEAMKESIMSFGFMPQSGNFGSQYDPLGRQGQTMDGDVKIPDEAERRRVQEIIRELRSRSNDYQRPKVERDYLDRLLDTFN
jgi:uncharacterized protein (TIGR02302 family)